MGRCALQKSIREYDGVIHENSRARSGSTTSLGWEDRTCLLKKRLSDYLVLILSITIGRVNSCMHAVILQTSPLHPPPVHCLLTKITLVSASAPGLVATTSNFVSNLVIGIPTFHLIPLGLPLSFSTSPSL